MKFSIPRHTKKFLFDYFRAKHFRTVALISVVLLALLLLVKFMFFGSKSFAGFFEILLSPYLALIANSAAQILRLIHHPVRIENFEVFTYSGYSFQLTTSYLSKTWLLITFSFLLLIPSDRKKTILFCSLALVLHFLLSILQIIIAALLISDKMVITDAKNVGYTFIVASFCILIAYWLKINKIDVNGIFPKNTEKDISKSMQIVLFFLGAVFFKDLIISLSNFTWLNDFLLSSTQYLLSLAGYQSGIKDQTLYGFNGNLFLAKYCLGLQSMYIFGAFVWLTGNKILRKSIFIISGIIFINLTNIVRLVLLFMHIQKYGDYKLAMDLHELFNITIYSLIFLMWVLWIEKLSDLWKVKKQNSSSDNVNVSS